MASNHTVVVGLGEAGCRMAATLADRVQDGGGDPESYQFVGIDTRPEDLEENTPDPFTTVTLRSPHRHFERDRRESEFAYLTEGEALEPAGGATRQRAVGRYYGDRNYDQLHETLDAVLEESAERSPNVWVLTAFGGGTGSGLFPLVAGLLETLTPPETWIAGIGSIPRLDQLSMKAAPPPMNPTLAMNAYAALRELAVLQGYPFSEGLDHDYTTASGVDHPLELPIGSSPNTLVGESLTLEGPPFEFFGLLPVPQANGSPNFEWANRTAASTVQFFADAEGIENFAGRFTDFEDPTEDRIYALDAAGVQAERSVIAEYLEIREDVEQTEAELPALREEQNRVRLERAVVESLLDADDELDGPPEVSLSNVHSGELASDPDEDTGVDVESRWQAVSAVYEHGLEAAESLPASTGLAIEEVDVRAAELSPEELDGLEAEPIAKLGFYRELIDELSNRIADHEFVDQVEQAWTEHRSDIDAPALSIADSTPMELWEGGLEAHYRERIRDLRDRVEGKILPGLFARSAKRDLKRLESWYWDCKDLGAEYRHLQQLHEAVRARERDARATLESVREDRSEKLDDIAEELERLSEWLKRASNRREVLADRLAEPPKGRFTPLPVADPTQITPETVGDPTCLDDFVEQGIFDAATVTQGLVDSIESLGNWLSDRDTHPVESIPVEILGVLATESNRPLLEDEVGACLDARNVFDTVGEADSDTVEFVAAYACVRLENSSEFGTIQALYAGDEQVSQHFGQGWDDEEFVAGRFAYPEWFPEDEQIQSWFGA